VSHKAQIKGPCRLLRAPLRESLAYNLLFRLSRALLIGRFLAWGHAISMRDFCSVGFSILLIDLPL
jgi:hypothetical protein